MPWSNRRLGVNVRREQCSRNLGLIAGNRSLPLVLAREARDAGVQRLVAAAFEKETDPHLEALVDEMEWLRVGQLGKLVEVFQKHASPNA